MGQTALQMDLNASSVIESNERVIFNTIKYSVGDISYNTTTGELTLSAAGRYVIDWWLAVQFSLSTSGAAFALETSQGDLIIGNSPIKTDEVYGIGIIEVTTAPVTVVLKNIGTGPIYLSPSVPLQGTLVLFEDVLNGPPGPTGPDGLSAYEVAVENGFVGTQQEWLNSLVGPQGVQGNPGPIAATIPFAAAGYGIELSAYGDGYPSQICFAGFGKQEEYIDIELGTWQTGQITFTGTMDTGISFMMPYDGVLKSLYVGFSSSRNFEFQPGVVINPFACIAMCTTDELTYVIQQDTMTYAAPYVGGEPIPQHTLRKGSTIDLNVPLAAGTIVAIVLGIMSEGTTEVQDAQLSITGGLFIE
ncbi:hypothetical protein [Clostridium minihomine]|uniref:hypothetical protein n=1 Tax=Clostridium minihomine TaxID=2045012 RepID=UPI000C78D7F9|nr:hypothetical protein [Clostridium minihomine]